MCSQRVENKKEVAPPPELTPSPNALSHRGRFFIVVRRSAL
jgi:hypothetical protein